MEQKRKIWSGKDLENLRALVLSGASAVRASVVLKRPLKAIKIKAKKLGVPFRHERELKNERRGILQS